MHLSAKQLKDYIEKLPQDKLEEITVSIERIHDKYFTDHGWKSNLYINYHIREDGEEYPYNTTETIEAFCPVYREDKKELCIEAHY